MWIAAPRLDSCLRLHDVVPIEHRDRASVNESERQRIHAAEYYRRYLAQAQHAEQQKIEIGKWLLGTLIVLHGGALVGILQTGAEVRQYLNAAGLYFLVGIVSALICGVFFWLNLHFAANAYDKLAVVRMLSDPAATPTTVEHVRKIKLFMTLAFFFGVISTGLLVSGALALQKHLH